MKTIFKNENWKPCLVLFFYMKKNIIYSFIASLYKENVLSVQRRTRLPFVKDYNRLWVIPLFFLSLTNCAYMSCTLFYSCMKIPILSPIIIFGEIFFDIKSSTIFSTKPLEIWLNTPTWTWTHKLGEIWNLCHCIRVLH